MMVQNSLQEDLLWNTVDCLRLSLSEVYFGVSSHLQSVLPLGLCQTMTERDMCAGVGPSVGCSIPLKDNCCSRLLIGLAKTFLRAAL